MAGTFTHFTVCNKAKESKSLLGKELWQMLNKHYSFLFLGAVSPDLPYLSFKLGDVNWADVMHYENTNSIYLTGLDSLKSTWKTKTDTEEAKFVWLAGYLSHLVTDATIHPVVKAIVGPYAENKDRHRICEMTEDSLIYKANLNGEIRYTEFSEMLKFCDETEYFGEVMEYWKAQILKNYSAKNQEPHPELWFETYKEGIDLAEGGSTLVAIFRHAGLGTNFIYKTEDEIKNHYPEDYDNYFTKVKVPNDQYGAFTDVFEKTIKNVLDAWKQAFDNLESGQGPFQLIKNWNLDTGEDMDTADKQITYWMA